MDAEAHKRQDIKALLADIRTVLSSISLLSVLLKICFVMESAELLHDYL